MTAVAGIDIALWDLVGKNLKTPVYNLLGGCVHAKIPAYASGFFGKEGRALTPAECGEEARQYADQGFKGVKMKVGFGRRQDLENLEAVRTALGPDLGIMVDANQSYSYHDVLKIADELAAFDLTFLEEPLPINDLDGMASLVQNVATPIAAGENYYTRYEFREIFAKRAVNIIQPDIIHAGGIAETKIIASLASAHNIPPGASHSMRPSGYPPVSICWPLRPIPLRRSISPPVDPTDCGARCSATAVWSTKTDTFQSPRNRDWGDAHQRGSVREIPGKQIKETPPFCTPADRFVRHSGTALSCSHRSN